MQAPPPPPTPGPIGAPSAPAPVQTALVQQAIAALAPPAPPVYIPPPPSLTPTPPTTLAVTPAQIAATMPTPPAIGASNSTPTTSLPSSFKGTKGPLPSDYYTDASLADWKQDLRPDPVRAATRGSFAVMPGGSSLAAPAAAAALPAASPLTGRTQWQPVYDPSGTNPPGPTGPDWVRGGPRPQHWVYNSLGRYWVQDWVQGPGGIWLIAGSGVNVDGQSIVDTGGGNFATGPAPSSGAVAPGASFASLPPASTGEPASSAAPGAGGAGLGGGSPVPAGTLAARFRAAPGAGPAAGATGWGSFAGAELAPSPARAVQPRSSYGAGPATINYQPQASWARYAVTVPTPIRTGEVGGFRSVPAAGAVGAYFGGGSLRRY